MLVVVQEGYKCHRYEKITDEDHSRVQVGEASEEHHNCCSDKEDQPDEQNAQPASSYSRVLRNRLRLRVLEHISLHVAWNISALLSEAYMKRQTFRTRLLLACFSPAVPSKA